MIEVKLQPQKFEKEVSGSPNNVGLALAARRPSDN
tara:strand:- start:574 stop:678 length:105 start_codon:yes stop_codon:yes gene_type:complete